MTERREQSLWCAVIQQALDDALSSQAQIRIPAIEWLTCPSRNFHEVCQSAGLEPEFVRAHAKKLIEAGPNTDKRRIAGPRTSPRCKFYEHDGRSMIISDWAAEIGVTAGTIYWRLKRGLSFSEAVTKPKQTHYKPQPIDQSMRTN
jgi:hypothetical protein